MPDFWADKYWNGKYFNVRYFGTGEVDLNAMQGSASGSATVTGALTNGAQTAEIVPIGAMYSASPEQVERMYRLLFGKPVSKKRKKRATRLEKVALDLMREFDPGPDLPALDLSSLKQAIALLDKPLETKRQTVEALLTKAIELTRKEIDEDDEEVIALFLAL